MVGRLAHPTEVNDVARYPRLYKSDIRYTRCIRWSKSLHDQIDAEAIRRGWSFSRMVRHLCEASIDGIE